MPFAGRGVMLSLARKSRVGIAGVSASGTAAAGWMPNRPAGRVDRIRL